MSKKVKRILVVGAVIVGIVAIGSSNQDAKKAETSKVDTKVETQVQEQPIEIQKVDDNQAFIQDSSARFQNISFYAELIGEESTKVTSNPNYYDWFKENVIYYAEQMVPFTYTEEEMSKLTQDQYVIAYDINTIVGFYLGAAECLKNDDLDGAAEYMKGVSTFIQNTAMNNLNNFSDKYIK